MVDSNKKLLEMNNKNEPKKYTKTPALIQKIGCDSNCIILRFTKTL